MEDELASALRFREVEIKEREKDDKQFTQISRALPECWLACDERRRDTGLGGISSRKLG